VRGDPFRGSIAVAAGLVTADQLRGPRFTRIFRGIYVRAGTEVDFALRCRAAALTGGGRGVLAGWAVGPYFLDMAYPELKIAVEYDGRGHLKPARAQHDLRRQAYLTAAGWTVLRFAPSVVLYEPWKIPADLGWLLRRR
jgi:very-short-patch-repair endonuclease